jgi:hypothetical protein
MACARPRYWEHRRARVVQRFDALPALRGKTSRAVFHGAPKRYKDDDCAPCRQAEGRHVLQNSDALHAMAEKAVAVSQLE